jgi:hypothetical protein
MEVGSTMLITRAWGRREGGRDGEILINDY